MKSIYKNLAGMIAVLALCMLMVSCAPSYVAMRSGPVYGRPLPPGPGYIWIDEGRAYRGGRYESVPGYWAPSRHNRGWRRDYHRAPGRW